MKKMYTFIAIVAMILSFSVVSPAAAAKPTPSGSVELVTPGPFSFGDSVTVSSDWDSIPKKAKIYNRIVCVTEDETEVYLQRASFLSLSKTESTFVLVGPSPEVVASSSLVPWNGEPAHCIISLEWRLRKGKHNITIEILDVLSFETG